MSPKTPLNRRILDKAAYHLVTHEGCTVDDMEYTDNGAKVMLRDVFGFCFELTIKTVGRVQDSEIVVPTHTNLVEKL